MRLPGSKMNQLCMLWHSDHRLLFLLLDNDINMKFMLLACSVFVFSSLWLILVGTHPPVPTWLLGNRVLGLVGALQTPINTSLQRNLLVCTGWVIAKVLWTFKVFGSTLTDPILQTSTDTFRWNTVHLTSGWIKFC